MRVAIVSDWLIGGGAERVVEQLHQLYPEAPVYTSYCSEQWRRRLDDVVVTGYLQHWPFSALRKFVPFLRIWWFRRLDFKGYDLVISSSGAEAKGIKTMAPTVHINYCHAPTHYYWSRYNDYLAHPGFGFFDPLARLGLRWLVGPLRAWDFKAAQRPDFMVANSSYTKAQIKKYYGRDSSVIWPPVDVERFMPRADEARHGFVTTSRLTPYKKIDLAVAACTQLELPLLVIGKGPDYKRLKRLAGKNVTFLQGKTDEEVAGYVRSSLAFIFPGVDDFGIVAVEAIAAGTPVIAYKDGGALDYVKEGSSGLFFQPQSVEALVKVLKSFKAEAFDSAKLVSFAQQFDSAHFRSRAQAFVDQAMKGKR